ncbi:hypothetical protein [Pontibacter mangrovi]|uniref:Uncharacterized protein n=1 Tax=Pontibacter mangrovi TaxID=2589816 RepID=A0A501W8X6_9BACT|nr:hypothetical protein [Pontibacter mangrovi]TPE43257.1 hypothetical protein FJM65_14185 [Pontibacter mangrovi]
MREFLRTMFGLNGQTGNRKVVDSTAGADEEKTPYLRESEQRLKALQELCAKYDGTPYAAHFKAALERTRRIHTYLAGRGRGHELELFHVQHTDHFLSTFTAILEAQQEPQELPQQQEKPISKPGVRGRTVVFGPFRSERKEVKAVQNTNRATSQRAYSDIAETKTEVPRLSMPEIAINTYAKIVYLREDVSDGLTTCEIGFTSPPEEKAAFESYVAASIGLSDITYVGNAMVYAPPQGKPQPAEMVPVIHWHGAPYALHLEELRLYPVRTYRKQW